jgi:hypothetical protein
MYTHTSKYVYLNVCVYTYLCTYIHLYAYAGTPKHSEAYEKRLKLINPMKPERKRTALFMKTEKARLPVLTLPSGSLFTPTRTFDHLTFHATHSTVVATLFKQLGMLIYICIYTYLYACI